MPCFCMRRVVIGMVIIMVMVIVSVLAVVLVIVAAIRHSSFRPLFGSFMS